jgi:hypothetical protein
MRPRTKRAHYRNGRSSITSRILRHIERHGSITADEAYLTYGCNNLDAEARQLAGAGYPIERAPMITAGGARLARWKVRG